MTQMGFFDVEKRYAALDANHDPLVALHKKSASCTKSPDSAQKVGR